MLVGEEPRGILERAGLGYCRSCNGRIRWVLTLESRRMPINPLPDAAGNLAVFEGAAHGGLLCRVITERDPLRDHEVQCMPHFATCPVKRPQPATPTSSLPEGVVSLHAHRRRRG